MPGDLDEFHPELALTQFEMWLERSRALGPMTDFKILELMVLAFDHGVQEGART